MKKKVLLLFVLLTVALLCLTACNNPSVNDLQKINDLLKIDYSKVTVLVNTKTATTELNGNFVLTFDGEDTTIKYEFDRVNTFDADSNGNIAYPDGDFIVREKGEVVVRDGAIIDGDTNVQLNLNELRITGFSFKQAYFNNANLKNAKFEADVVNPQKFTGDEGLICDDMHVIVFRDINANILTKIELTYTAENGAEVKLSYLFTK